jgi:enoyl-[acyl-carrier-protein] reductase (NADH)
MKHWRNPLPIGAYQPNDIGEVVRYFASDEARKITGEVFGVTAGLFARNTA